MALNDPFLNPGIAQLPSVVDGLQQPNFYGLLANLPAPAPQYHAKTYLAIDSIPGTLYECCLVAGALEWVQVAGGGGGGGTVTTVSVATANGVSGSVANPTTTPAITLTLGAITPTSVNSVVISGSSTPTLAVTGTTTVSGSNTGDQTITLTGAVTGSGTGSFATTYAGTVPINKGGTNSTTALGNSKVMVSVAGAVVESSTIGTGGGSGLTGGSTPTGSSDFATKGYVDTQIQGLAIKQECQTATVTTLAAYTYNNVATPPSGVGATITITTPAVLILDGYTVALGDRVLVKNETGGNAPYNGIYSITTLGTVLVSTVLTRTLDFDDPNDGINGAFVFIQNGTTNAKTGWLCNAFGSINFGTTNINWTQDTGSGTYTGTSGQITISSSNVVSIDTGYVGQTSITTLGTIATGTWAGTAIAVAHGGTGLTTLTAHGVMLGEGTGNVAFASPGTTGLPLLSTGASSDPAFGAMAYSTLTGAPSSLPPSGTAGGVLSGTYPNPGLNTLVTQNSTQIFRQDVNGTNSAFTIFQFDTIDSPSTPTAGFGSTVLWTLTDSTTNTINAANITVTWVVATHGSSTSRMVLNAYNNSTAREGLRVEAGSSAPMIGFLGASASVVQTGDAGTALVTFGLMSGTPTFAGANVTGTVAAATTATTSGSCSGNAATATALQNARTIGGVSFDGTANITVSTATGGFTVSGGAFTQSGGSFSLTGSGASTLTTSAAALTIDSAAALNIGNTNATSVAIGKSGITTTITGGLTQLTGVFSITGNSASTLTTSSGNTTIDSAAQLNVGANNCIAISIGNIGTKLIAVSIFSGSGTNASGATPATSAGTMLIRSGTGGDASVTSGGTASNGGSVSLSGGTGGGAATSTNGAGIGGSNSFQGGQGGQASSGFVGGAGGLLTISGGLGGTGSATQLSGAGGDTHITGGPKGITGGAGVGVDGNISIGATNTVITTLDAGTTLNLGTSNATSVNIGNVAHTTAVTVNAPFSYPLVNSTPMPSFISGLQLSYGSSTTIAIANGYCADSTNAVMLNPAAGTITVTTNGSTLGNDAFTAGVGTVTTSGTSVTGSSTLFFTAFAPNATPRAMTGTISSSSAAVTGTSTLFLSQISVGDLIGNTSSGYFQVTAIADNTHLTIVSTPGTPFSASSVNCLESPTITANATTGQVATITSNTALTTVATMGTHAGATSYVVGVPAATQFLFVWVGKGGSGTTTYCSTQYTTPYGLSGYNTYFRRVGSIWYNASAIQPFKQTGGSNDRTYTYSGTQGTTRVLSASGTASAWTGFVCSLCVPRSGNSIQAGIHIDSAAATTQASLASRDLTGGSNFTSAITIIALTGGFVYGGGTLGCDGAQGLQLAIGAGGTASITSVIVSGYTETL